MPKARVRRGLNKQSGWCFEPSICRPEPPTGCSVLPEATESYMRSLQSTWYEGMTGQSKNGSDADRAHRTRDNGPRWVPRDCRCYPNEEDFVPQRTVINSDAKVRSLQQSSWYNDMTVQPTYTSRPLVVADRTHDHLFGETLPAPPVVRRPDPGHVCNSPRWSPSDCPHPPAVDDFTRTRRNIHGDEQPLARPVVAPVSCTTPRTILAPDILPSVCCPPAGSSPVVNEEYERTRHNVFGPNDPVPLRLPVRTDDFVKSNLNLFGSAITLPLRLPQRTSDFDDSKRSLFGPHPPYVPSRPSLKPLENTYDDLFGKCQPRTPPRVTPPPALKQNINVLTTVERSRTPPRFPPRPQANTFINVFGRVSPATISKYCRQAFRVI